jgi:hypothetical protein
LFVFEGRGGGGDRAVRFKTRDGESYLNLLADNSQIRTGTATLGEGREGMAARVPEEAVATAVVDNHESSESIVRT